MFLHLYKFHKSSFPRRAAALALCASCAVGACLRRAAPQQQAPLTNAEFLALVRQLPQHPGDQGSACRGDTAARHRVHADLAACAPSSPPRAATTWSCGACSKRPSAASSTPRRRSLCRPRPRPRRCFERARAGHARSDDADARLRRQAARHALVGRGDDAQLARLRPPHRRRQLPRERGREVPPALRSTASRRRRPRARGATTRRRAARTRPASSSPCSRRSSRRRAEAEFKPLDTDTLRGRRTVVYSYDIKKANSQWRLETESSAIISAHRGKVWIDRERARILRIEFESYDVPDTFPIRAAAVDLDYDWVTIPGQGEYLLPSHSVSVLTDHPARRDARSRATRYASATTRSTAPS